MGVQVLVKKCAQTPAQGNLRRKYLFSSFVDDTFLVYCRILNGGGGRFLASPSAQTTAESITRADLATTLQKAMIVMLEVLCLRRIYQL